MNGMPYEHLRWVKRDKVLILEIVTAQLHGDLIEQKLCDELLAIWQQAQTTHAVLDLAAVQYLTSPVLRAFIALRRSVRNSGGRVILCNVQSENVLRILTTTRFITTNGSPVRLFEFASDLETALTQLEHDPLPLLPDSPG
ncbi:MAG: STAS domain-containing protein [Gemmatales bacterium]|nr:STAS domain-containing protein [Gemmatales bacterium]MDW8221518.1 STAS domain-containing protein [Gemmatales bacterium]